MNLMKGQESPSKLPPKDKIFPARLPLQRSPYNDLPEKIKSRLPPIRSLMIGMKASTAAKQKLSSHYVTLTNGTAVYPVRLILDKTFNEDITIISEDTEYGHDLTSDKMSVEAECQCLMAEDVSLCVISTPDLSESQAFTHYLKHQLVKTGLIVLTGMMIVVQYLSQNILLKVGNVKLFGAEANVPFKVVNQTQIHLENPEKTIASTSGLQSEVTFSNIGGYKTELGLIQQQIDILFCKDSTSGVKAVKGMLISGPPGSGKSLICEALRTKYREKCISVSLQDIKSKYRGETEQNLNQCFTLAATRAPCVVVIDDLDVLCGGGVDGGSSGSGRGGAGIVTALLHLLDGLSIAASQEVLVVGTASRAESLDAALRRPGRLSCDVALPHPNTDAREDILHKLLQGIPHTLTNEDVAQVAKVTPGYEGGDLRNVMVEGMMMAGTLPLSLHHLQQSLTLVKPAALRETTTLTTQRKLSDMLGYEVLKSKLCEAMRLTLQEGLVFQQCGLAPPSRFLLFGPPGCGKTLAIRALAAEFHLNIIAVKRSTVLGKYFGESELNLARIFNQANASAPCIIHFENFEGLAGKKKLDENGAPDVESRIINHLKVQLDGIVRNDHIFVFAETNRPDLLNTDLIRPGRFHEYHLVDLPDPSSREQLLKCNLPASYYTTTTLSSLVTATQSLTVAEVLSVCAEIREDRNEGRDWSNDDSDSGEELEGEYGGGTGQDDRGTGEGSRDSIGVDNGSSDTGKSKNDGGDSTTVDQLLHSIIPATSNKLIKIYKSFSKTYCSD